MQKLSVITAFVAVAAGFVVSGTGCGQGATPQYQVTSADLDQIVALQAVAASAMSAAVEQRKEIPVASQTERAFTLLDQIEGRAAVTASFVDSMAAGEGDISSLVQIVMFEAAEQEEEMLRDMIQEMANMNEAKARQRELMESYRAAREALDDAMRAAYDEATRDTISNPDTATKIERYTDFAEVIVTGSIPGSASVETFGGPLEVVVTCPVDVAVALTVRDMAANTQLSQQDFAGYTSATLLLDSDTYRAVRILVSARRADGVSRLMWVPCKLELTYPILVATPPWTPIDPLLSVLQASAVDLSSDIEELHTEVVSLSNPLTHEIPQDELELLGDIQAIMAANVNAYGIFLSDEPWSERKLLDDMKGRLDGMGAMTEEMSLRLQMTMDRRSKVYQSLSNIMKKISTTQETLVQNIK
jgi:hypothetical protein